MTFGTGADLRIVSRATLPNRFAEKGEIVAFRADGDTAEHVALIIGEPTGAPPLVRVHSECLTGDALGSLKCDCGPQLEATRWRRSRRRAGAFSSTSGRRGGASGWSTSFGPMRCRTRGSTRSTRTTGSASPTTSAISRWRRGCWRKCRGARSGCSPTTPRRWRRWRRKGSKWSRTVPLNVGANVHNRAYLDTKRDRSGHQL